MKQVFEVVVIGGGIIGCSIAYYLAKEKMDVAVIDGGQIGKKTTRAAAGMLGAHSESNGDFSVFFPFARTSQKAYIALKDELYALSGIDIGYREGGILKPAFTEEEKQQLAPLLQQPTVQWLDPHEVKQMEPTVNDQLLGAVYIREDVNVIPASTCESFAKSAQILGASIFENNHVLNVEKKQNHFVVETAKGDFEAKYVVMATGVYGNDLFNKLGLTEKLVPVKGETMIVHDENRVLKHTLFHDSFYIVPRNNGKIVIGATMVENDWSDTINLNGLHQLIEKAKTIMPATSQMKVESFSAGLRPGTFDGRPFIGQHPEDEKLLIACGHYRNGILLAPATGQMIRDSILGREIPKEWLEAFRIDRRQQVFI